MKKAPLVLGIVIALALAGAILWYQSWQGGTVVRQREGAPDLHPGRTSPEFSLADLKGNKVSSDQFRGKPTVINFFASWCPPCREEIPGFVEVYRKYRNRGFELVGISLDTDTRAGLPVFVAQNGIEYRILLGDVATARAYGGVSSLPTTVFIGKDGEIKNLHVGYMDRDAFEREVLKLL